LIGSAISLLKSTHHPTNKKPRSISMLLRWTTKRGSFLSPLSGGY
jgi:hypothetical protein